MKPGDEVPDDPLLRIRPARRAGCRTGGAGRSPSRSCTRDVRCRTSARLLDRRFGELQRAIAAGRAAAGSGSPGLGQLRSGARYAGGHPGPCQGTGRRPAHVELPHGDAGRHRPLHVAIRRLHDRGQEHRRDPHPQPAHRRDRSQGPAASRSTRATNGPSRRCSPICVRPVARSAELQAFTPAERRIIRRCRTPAAVQAFLNATALQHGAAARRRDAAQFPRRRAARHGALPGSGARRRGDPRAARLSSARPQLRIDRRAGSRDLRVSAPRDAGDRSPVRAIRACTGESPSSAPRGPSPSATSSRTSTITGRVTGYTVVDLRTLLGDYDWRLSEHNVWKAERVLLDAPHRPIKSSDARFRRAAAQVPGVPENARGPQAPLLPEPAHVVGAAAGQLVDLRRSAKSRKSSEI